MKIPPSKVKKFVDQSDHQMRVIFLFGPEEGLSEKYFYQLAKQYQDDLDDPFSVSRLTQQQLVERPSILLEEYQTIAFGNTKRLILILSCEDSCWPAFQLLTQSNESKALVIARAGNLAANSTLRKKFESLPDVAVLGCYANTQNFDEIINEALKRDSITMDSSIRHQMHQLFDENSLMGKKFIDILCLYVGKNGHLTDEMFHTCLSSFAPAKNDELAMVACDGDPQKLDLEMMQAWQKGQQPVQVIRMVLRHLMRLWHAGEIVNSGESAESAMKSLSPPVFFKQMPRFRQQMQIWKRTPLLQAIDLAQNCEVYLKKTNYPAFALSGRCLHQIAALARKLSAS
ncbi:MAG: DNA polymerase III subunit delta [Pseudomonadota bacterium]